MFERSSENGIKISTRSSVNSTKISILKCVRTVLSLSEDLHVSFFKKTDNLKPKNAIFICTPWSASLVGGSDLYGKKTLNNKLEKH